MNKYCMILIASACIWLIGANAPAAQTTHEIPAAKAPHLFTVAHALCSADDGKLWGVSLCGPMMCTDPTNHTAVTNQAVAGATSAGAVWRIRLPKDFPFANSAY